MWSSFGLLLLALGFAGCARNESNILRLSKQQKMTSGRTIVNATKKEDLEELQKTTRMAFSKNNPELDWQKYLHVAASRESQEDDQLDLDFMIAKPQKTGNSIKWFTGIYDPPNWIKVPGNPRSECKRDMEIFLEGLSSGQTWAAKMSDASGRYSSLFYFGNGFWLGSSTLCRELNNTVGKAVAHSSNIPPYLLSFHVARMYMTLPTDIELSPRQVFLGLCLPSSCERSSLTSMLRATIKRVEYEGNSTHRLQGPKIHIVNMRSVPSSDYLPWQDPKFYILCTVGGTILLLMIGSTLYEYRFLARIRDAELANSINNNERISTFADKNFPEERRLSAIRNGDKEMMEKVAKDAKKFPKDCSINFTKSRDDGILIKCLLAFSPMINGGKILNTDPAARDSLTCLHGLRVLSLGWVVMVHTYLQVFSIAENKTLRSVTERNFMFQTISNATFSVDTFFFISGLLVTVLFFRSLVGLKIDKSKFVRSSTSKFFIMVLYRYLRLTPAYLFVLGVNEIAIKYSLSYTVFSPSIIDHITCEKYWWRNALYINSLYPRTEMCGLWTWYISNDTQFYVIGIFLLLLSVRYFKFVASAVFFLIISSWVTTFSIAYANDYIARIQEPFALFDELYDKPWLRAGPYFVGTITGYILYKTNSQLRTPKGVKLLGWALSLSAMMMTVYGLYPGNLNVLVSSIYASLGHTAWATAVAFIVVQCCTGEAPIINSLLSLRLMYPLSRLTYCAYLVHPVIMMITSMQMDGPLHIQNGIVIIIYFGNLVAAYMISFFISLALEAPIVNLLKISFTRKNRIR